MCNCGGAKPQNNGYNECPQCGYRVNENPNIKRPCPKCVQVQMQGYECKDNVCRMVQ